MIEKHRCSKCGSELPNDVTGRVECADCHEITFVGDSGAELQMLTPEFSFSIDATVRTPPATALFGQPEGETALASGGSESFQDIVSFGNSETLDSNTGGLVYHIKLAGVDTAELRQELLEALDDKRLKLDAKVLMKSIKAGRLDIINVNPVKAAVLLNRIKHLPLMIRWSADQMVKKMEPEK